VARPLVDRAVRAPTVCARSRQGGAALRRAEARRRRARASKLHLSAFEEGIAAAATNPAQPVLVSIFLEGGADGLSVLSPQGDPLYRKFRPKLGLSGGTALAEDSRLFWHPAAAGITQLYGEQKVTVMPAIGYTNADQSHFTSRHYWEVGATNAELRTGWLGRYLDGTGSMDNPLQGLSLDDTLAPSLATSKVPVASIDGPDNYDFWSNRVWGEVETRMLSAIGALGAANGDPAFAAAARVTAQVDRLRNQLLPFQSSDNKPGFTSPVPYPKSDDAFPRRLAGLAAMLGAGLPLHVVALSAPGSYDTHSNQPGALATGLQLTSDSLLAFQRDLEARGLADRVLVHVWSEFGRRAQENGDAGTDHGAAGVGFLIGTRAKAQMIGEYPGLQSGLDSEGNVKATSDFRGVYASLLEQWLGVDAARVIPNAASFTRPLLVR
jgi:uncharacterized protein (DUF1501 family)